MGEQLIKPYQISVWEDRLIESDGESYYEEVKIAEIGSDTMTSHNRVYSPVFKINTNGEKTLTFSLKYKYYDETVGDFVVNPFERFLVNERKIKLFYKDEWHDFVIKEKEEESEEYTFSYTCTDLFVQELSKNGYGITFNTDLNNNQGTIVELAEKTLEDTDWVVDKENSDLLQQTICEPIYECVVGNEGFTVLNTKTNEEISIAAEETIYIFYSYIQNKSTVDVQFIRAADRESWSYDNNNAIVGTNYRFLESISYNEEGTVITYGTAAINIGLINTESQGYRLVYNNLKTYDPVTGQTVDIYRATYSDGRTQDFYHYTTTHYNTASALQNYITNGSNFTTNNTNVTGWSNAVKTEANRLLSIAPTTYPELTDSTALAQISQLKQIKGYLELEFPKVNESSPVYANSFFNNGIVDNAAFVGGIAGGDRFLLRYRYQYAIHQHGTLQSPLNENSVSQHGLRAVVAGYNIEEVTLEDGTKANVKVIDNRQIYIDFDDIFSKGNVIITGGKFNADKTNYLINGIVQTPSTKYIYKQEDDDTEYVWSIRNNKFISRHINNPGQRSDIFVDYYYTIATARKSLSQEKLSDPSNRIGIFVYKNNTNNQWVYIEDIEITRYYEDANGNPIFVGSAPEAKMEVVNNFYLKPESGMNSASVELYSSLDAIAADLNIDVDIIQPVMNEKCEKILSIEASKSNCFNILQDLCETFECWMRIEVEHDSIGRLKLDKNHHPNKQVVFKQYVGKDNFAGFRYGVNLSSINRTIDSNEFVTKLIVGQPTSEYTAKGILNIGDAKSNPSGESYILNFNYYLNQGLIKNKEQFNTDLNNFNKVLKEKNIEINNLNDQYIVASAALEQTKATRNIYAESADVAAEKYAKALTNFESVTGQSYTDFIASNPDPEQLEKNEALRKVIDELYAAAVEVNNYRGLLTNINKEYDKLNLQVNGAPTYTITVTTYNPTVQGIDPTTTVILSDYFEGFKCTLVNNDSALYTSWESGINDKDFEQNIFFTKLIINSIPENYEFEYVTNSKTHQVVFTNSMTFDIAENNEGKTRSFRLIPTEEYSKQYIGLKQQIDDLIEEKTQIEKDFYSKYSRFIQEGTWESNDYIDNELYYMDALQVSNASAQPKVTYTINVLEVSELQSLKNYEFNVGDRTYIEDTDFFGWEYFEENGVNASTPVKEIVVVTEVEWHLDEPETNTITVQNYKTEFEDLFQRITATVQSVEYNQASYMRAASILDSSGHINPTLLIGSLNAIAGQSFNLATNGILKVTDDGLIVRNLTEPQNLIIIKGRGIEKSNNGGLTWENLISPQGVNTELLTAGSVNTNNITILDGKNPSFRWDSNGISAYGFIENNTRTINSDENKLFDLNTYVRFDKYGIYGVQNGEDYVATSLDDIKQTASFGLTWDGFFIKNKYRDGYVSISSTDDIQVVSNDIERIKIGKFNDVDKYGIRIRNDSGSTVFETDDNGDISMAGIIRAAGGEIGGFTIGQHELRNGQIGKPGSVFLSTGYSSANSIADSPQNSTWAVTVGNTFGVDVDGHLYATAASIRGNIYADNGYFSGHIDATSGTFMNELRVGGGEKYIVLQGYADRPDSLIASSDYINNPTAGWAISGYGDAIFNNVSVRGAIKTAVFEYNEIEAVGGAFLFRPSTTIKGARIQDDDIILTLEKANLFEINEWVKVSNVNTKASNVSGSEIIDDGGLTHVYKITNINDKEITLEDAAHDFIDNNSSISDGWGAVQYGYRVFDPTIIEHPDSQDIFNPSAWGLYELDNEQYILTEDTTAQPNKDYYEQFYPDYTTIHFSEQYSQENATQYENLRNYVDLKNNNNNYIQLNAPKYEVYFNGYGYIKNMNFELRNTASGTVETLYNEVTTYYEDINTGERWDYTIKKYIGNLALFSLEFENTGEDFLIAEVEESYKATSQSTPIITSYTRIYSNLNGIITFVLQPLENQASISSLEGGSLISFGFYNEAFRPFNVTASDNPKALGLYELIDEEYVLTTDEYLLDEKVYYKDQYENGTHNYGIGINSSDNYVNLPQRAISLFESTIHPDDTVKVTYDFKGILGTLPSLGNSLADDQIYPYMEGTQGIFTNNMYIGDSVEYLAFYTDGQGHKKLKIKANQIMFENSGGTWSDISDGIPLKYFFWFGDIRYPGVYAASGIDNVTFDAGNINTYGYNLALRSNELQIGYNNIKTILLDGLHSALTFYIPTQDGREWIQGEKGVEITSAGINIYNPYVYVEYEGDVSGDPQELGLYVIDNGTYVETTDTQFDQGVVYYEKGSRGLELTSNGLALYGSSNLNPDASLTANGLKLAKGGIGAGTANQSGFVYLSTDNYGSYTIQESTYTDWKQLIGTNFGIRADGSMYATNANIAGNVIAAEGTIGGFTIRSGELYSLNHSNPYSNESGIYIGTSIMTFGPNGTIWFDDSGRGKIGLWSFNLDELSMTLNNTQNIILNKQGIEIKDTTYSNNYFKVAFIDEGGYLFISLADKILIQEDQLSISANSISINNGQDSYNVLEWITNTYNLAISNQNTIIDTIIPFIDTYNNYISLSSSNIQIGINEYKTGIKINELTTFQKTYDSISFIVSDITAMYITEDITRIDNIGQVETLRMKASNYSDSNGYLTWIARSNGHLSLKVVS